MDLNILTQAVGELDEDKVLEMLNDFVGSNPTEEEAQKEACEHVGADAFTTNAAEGVKICQGWVM